MAARAVSKRRKQDNPRFSGQHIVTDAEICHGKPTFRGMRILVSHVLEQVSEGTAWKTIIKERRATSQREAVLLASQAFLEGSQE
jgi:uncharacterized protein (DUF433 family)